MNLPAPNRESRAQRFPLSLKMRVAAQVSQSPREHRVQLVRGLAATNGASERSVWRWFSEFERRGSSAFRRARADKGHSRYFESHPEVAARVARLWASQRSVRAIHNELFFDMLTPPSLSTVQSFVRLLVEARPQ